MTLLIDTAHDVGYISQDDALFLMEGRAHSETAPVLLERVWKESPCEVIGVGIGPGSYTGVRVGIALAQGLHLATGVPLVGYCSLEAYWEPGTLALFDARAGGVYCWDGERAFRLSIEELSQVERPLISPDAQKISERLKRPSAVREGKISLTRIVEQVERGEHASSLTPLYLKNLA